MNSAGVDLMTQVMHAREQGVKSDSRQKTGNSSFQDQLQQLVDNEKLTDKETILLDESGSFTEELMKDELDQLFSQEVLNQLPDKLSELIELLENQEQLIEQLIGAEILDEADLTKLHQKLTGQKEVFKEMILENMEEIDQDSEVSDLIGTLTIKNKHNLSPELKELMDQDLKVIDLNLEQLNQIIQKDDVEIELDSEQMIEELTLEDMMFWLQVEDLAESLKNIQSLLDYQDIDGKLQKLFAELEQVMNSSDQIDSRQEALDHIKKKYSQDNASQLFSQDKAELDLEFNEIHMQNEDSTKNILKELKKISQLINALGEDNLESKKSKILITELKAEEAEFVKQLLATSIATTSDNESSYQLDMDNKNIFKQLAELNHGKDGSLNDANFNVTKQMQEKIQNIMQAIENKDEPTVTEDYLFSKLEQILSQDSSASFSQQFHSSNFGAFAEGEENNVSVNQIIDLTQHFNNDQDVKPVEKLFSQRSQELVNNLREAILQQVNLEQEGDTHTLKMKLKPEQLGQLRMQFSYQDGELKGHIFTQNAQARDVIQANLVELRNQLGEQGLEFNELDVSVDQEQDDENGEFDLHRFNFRQNISEDGEENSQDEQDELDYQSEDRLAVNYENNGYGYNHGSIDLRI
ncbi:flagellar hook-length control protein FliK [Natranaerobius thermophilus]|uniref:Flagellar hook-length control protein n=1 Tax=Natranaerobius thermophilus (strain ATCC BAA-1301 / DSM 18059 / JW/NM-WN-LF) TaxID=457570 RepID=B2A349_NATTJ|nr:flagellar hook-length control protein FliK [Natranaerobius thermophilus]ACB84980.1 flagellar hook-length control protein [Natranaerobius thermophilus JW/NM-WN-LF]